MKLHQYELAIPGWEETQEGYVLLTHGQRYSLRICNHGSMLCDVEIAIDGNPIGTFRLEENSSAIIERPVHDDGFFTFYELFTDEATKSGLISNESTGLVTAIFKPESNSRILYQTAPPSPGGTGLSGHSKQIYKLASPINYAHRDAFVTISLRLGGRASSNIRPLAMRQMSTPVPPPLG